MELIQTGAMYINPAWKDLIEADHVASVESDLAEVDLSRRTYNTKLTVLRAQHPALMVSPVTNKALAVRLVPGSVVDIDIPSGTKMVRFNSDGFFLLSRNGRAELPADGVVSRDAGAFYPNADTFYYVEEIHQLSIISDMQVRVSIECFAQI
jgi:hypothetical protein